MSQVLLGLGDIFFYSPSPNEPTPGFDNLQRDRSFSWPAQGRLNQDMAMQFTGPGEDIRIVEGTLYPHLFGGLRTLDLLDSAGEAGEPLLFSRFYLLKNPTQYVAEFLGEYVISRLRRADKVIGGMGTSNQIDFSIELKAFGRDPQDGGVGDFVYTS